MGILKTTEKLIENSVLDFLNHQQGMFAFKVNTRGIYDPTRNVFRTLSKGIVPGTADIICCYYGRFIAIEVKSDLGIQSDVQKNFERLVKTKGIGHYFVIRSIEDVKSVLSLLNHDS